MLNGNRLAHKSCGNSLVELFHTHRGYECRLSYMGQARYTTVHSNEMAGIERYYECCAHWGQSANPQKGSESNDNLL